MLNTLDNLSDAAEPPAVQSHGVCLGVTGHSADAKILAASAADAMWGVDASALIGAELASILDISSIEPEEWSRLEWRSRIGPYRLRDAQGITRFVSFTRLEDQCMVHVESPDAHTPDDVEGLLTISRYIEQINGVREIAELWSVGCEALRNFIGFDRTFVMELSGTTGEVVAEAVRPGSTSILGAIVDAPAGPGTFGVSESAPLLAIRDLEAPPASVAPDRDDIGWTWNLSHSPLRMPTPSLYRMMRALDSSACYIISVGDANARYLIVSMSTRQRAVDAFSRVRTSMLAQLSFARTRTLQQRQESARRLQSMKSLDEFAKRLRSKETIMHAVVPRRRSDFHALDLVRADAMLINLGGECRTVGGISPIEERAILNSGKRWATALQQHRVLKTDDVRSADPRLFAEAPSIAGNLTTALGADEGFVTWIRRCSARQALRIDLDPALPEDDVLRTESGVDRIAPWDELDTQDAIRFVRTIEEHMLRSAEAELAELALYDPLTGLPNRRLLAERIGQAMKRRTRGRSFILAFIDLNDFKSMNDTFGHRFGDDLLTAVGQRLQESVRASDTVARLGGDEFVALFEDVTPGERGALLERLAHCFTDPFVVHTEERVVSAAIGATEADDGDTVESLLERADVKMYAVKALMKTS